MLSEEEKQKHIRTTRCCVCICSTILIAIAATFLGFYASMWADAVKLGDSVANYNDDIPVYDRCLGSGIAILNPSTGVSELGDTKWTVIFTFNTIVYACMVTFAFCQILGTFFWPLCLCACSGHCCLAIAHIACIIVTGVLRYQSEGEKCAKNGYDLGEDFDWTFKDHGDAIQGLFISQCVLLIVMNCIWLCTCNAAAVVSGEDCEKAFGRNQNQA